MRLRTLAAVATAAVLPLALTVPLAEASNPATSTITVGAGPQMVTYEGTIPPGAGTSCIELRDDHAFTLVVPPGTYETVTATVEFKITWSDPDNDEILSVFRGAEEVDSSDGSTNSERVVQDDLAAGTYTVSACPFLAATPQAYTGTITVTTTERPPVPQPAPSQGLSFSATVPADFQRDSSEPLIETDIDGKIYTCGPTGASGQAEYAQVSTDGGDQFHLLGQQPRGQIAAGGGGDCALALSDTKLSGNPNAPFAYTGLQALTTFSTAKSLDSGRTLTTSAVNGQTPPGVDRQWNTFTDANTVLLSYNKLAPRAVVVQKSTDGGLTYGAQLVVSPNPTFPGPIRSFERTAATGGGTGHVVFYSWTAGTDVNLAVSMDGGATWNNCQAVAAGVGPDAGFTSTDSDEAGNVYLSYAEEGAGNDTFVTMLPRAGLDACKSKTAATDTNGTGDPAGANPGFLSPVRVNRGAVETTVFPWVAAGGEPGRVAVAFYGTESVGDPNTGTFKATWDVYVNQSTDFLPGSGQNVTQTKATTHPFHYDSICLNGLGCILPPAGDRSLADFFAIEYSKADGRLSVVYNQGSKKPDETEGHVATPAVVTQEAGPSNGGGTVSPRRAVVRTTSTDPTGDALAPYSALNTTPPTSNRPVLDITDVSVGPEVVPATGAPVADGGFTVTMKVASLATAELNSTITSLASQGTGTNSLVYLFRFVNGFQAAGATARYTPAGFTFRYDDYTTDSAACGSSGEKCIIYPGAVTIPGKVDAATGTITMSVPRARLRQLVGPTGNGQRPTEQPATQGARFYDGTALTLANTSPDGAVRTFAVQVDNAPAMDFILGAADVDQEPVVPEAPLPILLVALGAALAAGVALRRRSGSGAVA